MPLHLQGLTQLRADGSAVLREVELTVDEGEILVLTGPAGSGKSALLRLVAGLEEPSAGQILLPRARPAAPAGPTPARRGRVLRLTPRSALPPGGTAAASILWRLPPHARERALGAAGRLGIPLRRERPVAALSAGEHQAALLARAVGCAPSVLLLDDVVGAMDPRLRERAREELAALADAGTAVLLATPDPSEALRIGVRTAVLDRGRLAQVAPAATLYERPATLAVAAFFGTPPMNLFEGALVRVENGVRFRGASFTLAVAPLDPRADEVVLGVRPEHVLVVGVKPDRAGSPDALATVRRVEHLGAGALLHCRTEQGEELTARTAEPPERHGEDLVGVRIDRAHLHLFDLATGERVSQPPAVGERWWVG